MSAVAAGRVCGRHPLYAALARGVPPPPGVASRPFSSVTVVFATLSEAAPRLSRWESEIQMPKLLLRRS